VDIKNKRIVITGGAGFIGFHLAKKLSKNNKVFLWDNLSRGQLDKEFRELLKNRNVIFKNIDLQKKINIKLSKIDYLFHLAGSVGVKNIETASLSSFLNNVNSLKSLINFSLKQGKKLKFILFSTSEVYSNLIKQKKVKFPISEKNNVIIENEIIDRDSYFLSKIFNEKLIQLSKINYLILRPHNIYGPRMGFSHVIPELIKKFLLEKKGKKKYTGIYSPSHTRAFCFIDDAIKQILLLSSDKNNNNEIFNIGNMREEIKIFNLAKKIKEIVFKKSKLKRLSITQGSPVRRVPCMKKTLKKIAFKKFTNLDDGIQKTFNWYRKFI
jgi:nucleoside-diphosphate-sugar epimerase